MATPSAMPIRRVIKRSLLDTRWATTRASPASPAHAARTITTVQHTAVKDALPSPLLNSRAHPIPTRELPTTPKPPPTPRARGPRSRKPAPPPPSDPTPRCAPPKPASEHTDASLDPSIHQLLPLLKAQAPHYLRAHIHGKPYLLTAGDTVRLPFFMHGVLPGDILRLNRASLLGSRDYTLRAGSTSHSREDHKTSREVAYIDERLFTCRARVLGTEVEPLRVKEKTKRRQRHIRRVKSKHAYTVLRVMEVGVSDVDAIAASGEVGLGSVEEVIERDDKEAIEELVEKTAKVTV